MKPRLIIDLDIIKSNYQYLCSQTKAKVGISIKSDAYGLGADNVAPALFSVGCRSFFVANIDEAVNLSQFLDTKIVNIYVFNGFESKAELNDLYLKHNIYPALNTISQLDIWNEEKPHLKCIMHIDTGMNRYGLLPNEVQQINYIPQNLEYVISHLACDSDRSNPYNKKQLELFKKLSSIFPCKKSLAASGGIFLGEEYHFDLVRPGGLIYGTAHVKNKNLQNPVSLSAPIIKIQECGRELYVGYDKKFHAKKGTRLATIPIGYGDGIPRSLQGKGKFFVNGKAAPIAKSISMDYTIIDVTNIPCNLGDEVEIIGPNNRPDIVASYTNIISYELISHLKYGRYERIYKESV